jgi:HEAT repeat protein
VRITAIEALGKIGTPAAIKSVACALDDDAEPVIGEAARVIGCHRFAPAVPKLLALLASLPKWSLTRGWCAEALGEIGDASAVEPLITVITDAGLLSVHSFAASALAKLRDTRALQPLEQLLASRDPDARAAAEAALTELRASPGATVRGPAEPVI